MNTDNYFNSYIENLISTDIAYSDFKTLIEIFSKFIAFTNPDYKYNGTYLQEYVNDFCDVIEKLKKKNNIYLSILRKINSIIIIGDLEINIDNTYKFKNSQTLIPREHGYYALDIEKIKNNDVEISIYLRNNNGRTYLLSQKYNLSEENYIEKIKDDVSEFYDNFLEKEGLQDDKNEFN